MIQLLSDRSNRFVTKLDRAALAMCQLFFLDGMGCKAIIFGRAVWLIFLVRLISLL